MNWFKRFGRIKIINNKGKIKILFRNLLTSERTAYKIYDSLVEKYSLNGFRKLKNISLADYWSTYKNWLRGLTDIEITIPELNNLTLKILPEVNEERCIELELKHIRSEPHSVTNEELKLIETKIERIMLDEIKKETEYVNGLLELYGELN